MATTSSRRRPARKYSVAAYRENQQRIPPTEIAKHVGKWAAFSRDGKRVVASATTLERLEKKLHSAGEDPEHVVFEFLDEGESIVGGAEFL